MTEAIVVAIRIVSFVVIVIILAVMANTMAMSARERTSEYATLKALGFGPGFLATLIFGESAVIAAVGAGIGIAAGAPGAGVFKQAAGIFPVFEISPDTVVLQLACAAVVAVAAAVVPEFQAARVRIVD